MEAKALDNSALTSEEQAAIDAFNAEGIKVSENALAHFMPSWFANIRKLIQAPYVVLHPVDDLVQVFSRRQHIVVLGSGPSAVQIARDLPRNDPGIALICGPTCVGTLLAADRKPDIVVVADSNPEQYETLRDLAPSDSRQWKIVLPVTADPSWYAKSSILDMRNLYFYLPYLSYFGSVELAYNDILKTLFPDIRRYISQAGSVGNTMLVLANLIAGESPLARVHLAVDCCGWLSDPPILRAPAARKRYDGSYEALIDERTAKKNAAESIETLKLSASPYELQTNLTSLNYAVLMFFIIHQLQDPKIPNRFSLLSESSALFRAVNPEALIPSIHALEVGMPSDPLYSPNWAYSTLLKLIETANAFRASLDAKYKEASDGHASDATEQS